jgi:hypothetical protein
LNPTNMSRRRELLNRSKLAIFTNCVTNLLDCYRLLRWQTLRSSSRCGWHQCMRSMAVSPFGRSYGKSVSRLAMFPYTISVFVGIS